MEESNLSNSDIGNKEFNFDSTSYNSATDNIKIDPNNFDLAYILHQIKSKREEQGIKTKSVDVIFKNLSITAKNTSAFVLKDVGDVFFPIHSFFRNRRDKRKSAFDFNKLPKTRKIIKDATGYALPGSMTLVLGRPGAGCSTFLKVIAGETKTYIGYDGEIKYGGIDSKEMFQHYKNELIYNPELDIHFPYLTVEETMQFAVGCKTPSTRIDNFSRQEYVDTMKDLYLTLFGLKDVEKTLVGDDFVKGISGGQRKRVSIAEAMVTNGTVYAFDNATRGLDSSTALDFVKSLKTITKITNNTSLVTVYQASENIYQLFDNVTIFYLGRQVYFGSTKDAVDYFHRMGYTKPTRQTTSEFLTCVTDPLARIMRDDVDNTSIPKTADEFEYYWKKSPEFAQLAQFVDSKLMEANPTVTMQTFDDISAIERQKWVSPKSPYTINFLQQMKLCCRRRYHNLIHNKTYSITLVAAATIQALIVGSLYYNISTDTSGAFSRGGVLFYSCLYFALMCLSETADLFIDKPILNKQYDYSMYQPSAELLAKQLVHFPVRVAGIITFTIIVYFLSHLKKEAGAFFSYFLFVNLVVQSVNSLFILMASFMPTFSAATAINGICLMATVVYSSFMIQKPSMYWWFKWFSYCNPILFGFESMILMEFNGRKMPCSVSSLIPTGVAYENINSSANQVCAFVGGTLSKIEYNGDNDIDGMIYLSLSFDYIWPHMWRNLGIMFCFVIGYLGVNSVLVEYYNPIVASSDKLIFVHCANVPLSILEALDVEDTDPEKSVGVKNDASEKNSFESSHFVSGDKSHFLGSDDIFMWKNVNYTVQYDGEDRKLLDDIQGYVLPGTLTALMGESGACKTTLLNVLSKRVDVGVVTGDMLINCKVAGLSFERRTGYVQQQDLHVAELTVREALIFSARLRRPGNVPDDEKIAYVDEIIDILHMHEYVDSITGTAGYGLSVEQRKKLSIATELVAKPSLLLFLDEPTSGLDSQSSWAIVQVLRSLADAGQTILCTIHQPSALLFEEFDKLLLLKRGGKTVYFGDIGANSTTVLGYFESHGARKCLNWENPAEYILEVVGAGSVSDTIIEDWNKIWLDSFEYRKVSTEIEDMVEQKGELPESDDNDFTNKYAVSYGVQFVQVLKRTFLEYYRDLDYIMSKLMLSILAGLLIGFSFWNVKHTIIGMQNAMFASFMAVVISAPMINQIQGKAITVRELYEVRESKSNTFHWSLLMLCQFLCEIPFSIVFSTVYFICWYFPIQLDNEASRAGMWWFTYAIFFQMYYVLLGLAIVYISPDLPTANVLIGLALNFIMSFAGVIQNSKQMPGFWKFMWRLSPYTYFIDNLLSVLLHHRPVVCGEDEYSVLDPPEGLTCGEYLEDYFVESTGYVNNENATKSCQVCQYKVGDEYLATVGLSWNHRWRNIGLFCAYIGFNLIVMCHLYYFLRVKKCEPFALLKRLIKRLNRK